MENQDIRARILEDAYNKGTKNPDGRIKRLLSGNPDISREVATYTAYKPNMGSAAPPS